METSADDLPSGTVTFLLSDIEGSSGRWERDPESMRRRLATHDALAEAAVRRHRGTIVKHTGDGCWAAFARAADAAAASAELQRRHQESEADDADRLRIRIGLHTGEVTPTGRDYFGPAANRIARVTDLANGDQIVCSSATAALLDAVPVRSDGWHELRGIGVDEVFVLEPDGVRTDPAPLRRPVVPSNLPSPRTKIVGRTAETDRISKLLGTGGGVFTLLGPGGVGKTRLAIEVARRARGPTAHRTYFCDLSPLSDPGAVAELVAETIGARRQPGLDLLDSIADFVRGDELVILDNCEHVIGAACELAGRLSAVDGVDVLTTSRVALRIPQELVIDVTPLRSDTDGVELFVTRARQRHQGFEPSDADTTAIARVVHHLDGLPLAIELAAARIRLMTPVEMAERLDRGAVVLPAGAGTSRHDTMESTIRWSHDLLEPAEQLLFRRLGIMSGSCSLHTIEEVCTSSDLPAAELDDLVLALVDKSMLTMEEADGRRRFRLLEPLRQFATAELAARDDGPRWRRRHAAHFLAIARRADAELFGEREPEVWQTLDAEWSNLRAALDAFEDDDDVDHGAELVLSLAWYASMSMRVELFGWAVELLATPGIEKHPAYTDLCGAAAIGAYFTVDPGVTALAEAGLAADPSDPRGFCRCALAAVFLNNVHTAEASDALTAAWLRSNPAGTGNRIWAHAFRTFHLCIHDPGPAALEQAAAVRAIATESGSVTAQALAAWAEGQTETFVDLDRGIATWNEGREWARSVPGNHLLDHLLVGLLLHVSVRRGDLGRALADCRSALADALAQHYYVGVSHLFGVTAIALSRAGDPVTGARLLGSMVANGNLPRRNARRELGEALGDRLDDAMADGRHLTTTEAARVALAALDEAVGHQTTAAG